MGCRIFPPTASRALASAYNRLSSCSRRAHDGVPGVNGHSMTERSPWGLEYTSCALVGLAGTLFGCGTTASEAPEPSETLNQSQPAPALLGMQVDPPRGDLAPWFRVHQDPALESFTFKGIGAFAIGDVDGDGLPDVVTAADVEVFRNLGGLRFEAMGADSGLPRQMALSVALADLDNDGDLDLVGSGFQTTDFWENDGAGHFTRAQRQSGAPDLGASQLLIADFNSDSLLDVFIVYPASFNLADPRVPSALILNQSTVDIGLQFATPEVQDSASIGWAAAIIDFDGDGHLDVQVANDCGVVDFGFAQTPVRSLQVPSNLLLKNNGRGEFVDVARATGLTGRYSAMGALVEDFNGDGAFDIFTPDFGRNKLHLATEGGFVESAEALGLTASHRVFDGCDERSANQDCLLVSWGSAYRDFNLDGRDDLLILNHAESALDASGAQPAQLYQWADGPSGPLLVEHELGLGNFAGHALAPVDLDEDGDLDIVLSTVYDGLHVLENTAVDGSEVARSIEVSLRGSASTPQGVSNRQEASNRQGIGAVVQLLTEDDSGVVSSQRRLVGAGGVVHTSLPASAHFGVGDRLPVELSVEWPSGNRTVIERPELGRRKISE